MTGTIVIIWVGGGLALLALGLNVWQWVAGRAFLLARLPQEVSGGAVVHPGVSVLKPLKGVQEGTHRCLESWMVQECMGPMEVLFGVESDTDPACEVVREVQAAHPEVVSRLVMCGDTGAANAKVGKLEVLARCAQHGMLVVSDADVLAPRGLVWELAGVLRSGEVGLACCLYRFVTPGSAAARCEALAVNADFWSQVLQSRTLWRMDFALGAVMAMGCGWLERAGGFGELRGYVADDFQLGQRVRRAGGRVEVCRVAVDCLEVGRGWWQMWVHQVRWGRTIRACRPVPYFFSILGNGTMWALGLMWVGLATGGWGIAGWALGLGLVCLAGRVAVAMDLQRRFVPESAWRAEWWLVPVRDLMGAAVWLAAFLGRGVKWRGRRLRVVRGGMAG